ncbi:TPA: DUF1737 domain-containing protein [Enterobacter ludwigii]|nr:DUF1737 domain-containing protein [Enterobacter ludwigii]
MAYTNYKVVVGANADELTEQVTEAIADGFQPFGPPLMQWGSFSLAQAVVKGTPDAPAAGGSE